MLMMTKEKWNKLIDLLEIHNRRTISDLEREYRNEYYCEDSGEYKETDTYKKLKYWEELGLELLREDEDDE